MKKLLSTLLAGSLLFSNGFTTTFAQEENPFEGEKVSVGVASEYEEETWQVVVDKAAEEGIEVELVLFTDYVQPNIALADGSIDLNAFQHIAFLEEWNQENDGDLQPLGFTYVAPLRVYSDKYESLDEVQEGETIGIPSDPTNGGRALLALETAGLIEVDDAAGVLPTVSDITKNDKNIEFEELDAAQLPTALPDLAAAVINNNFALDAGLSVDDAIFSDGEDIDSLAADYKNVLAAKAENVDNPLFKRILELYQSEDIAAKLDEVSNGADLPAWSENDTYPVQRESVESESGESSEEESDSESSEE